MRILVLGATGMVGRQVVEQALERGHSVTAVARNAHRLPIERPELTKVSLNILDRAAVIPILSGIDAVISAVGIGTQRTPTRLYSDGTRNILAGMDEHGVKRIVVISSGAADHWAHASLFRQWIALPLLEHFLGATYDDMRRMDVVLWESDARWTTVRAPRIRNSPAKGTYQVDLDRPIPRKFSITAPDLAGALLDVTERSDLGRMQVHITN